MTQATTQAMLLHEDDASSGGQEYLVFTLDDQEYGIDILKVQEIRGYDSQHVTRIANAPAFIKGVSNLRGTIVPIIDMRIKFHLENAPYDHQTVVIILSLASRVVGIVVDGVSDVLSLQPAQLSPAPQTGTAFSAQYLLGIGTLDARMLMLLDIEALMEQEDMGLIDRGSDAAQTPVHS